MFRRGFGRRKPCSTSSGSLPGRLAAVGTVAWVLVGYLGYEVGWIAWGVGFLAGLGVRIAAGEEKEGVTPGIIAAAIAIGAVLLGKYCVAYIAVNSAFSDMGDIVSVSTEQMISDEADKYVDELEQGGSKITLPEGADNEDTPLAESYPKEVWAEADRRWNALSPDDQKKRTKEYQERVAMVINQIAGSARDQVFKDSFTPWDLLWFGLALVTAFKVGSATYSEND